MSGLVLALSSLVALLVLFGVAALWMKKHRRRPDGRYQRVKPLSEPEQVLYWRLNEAMPECVVLGQVAFSRFLRPEAASHSTRRALLNAISQKTADFLVCLPDFTVVAAVELDDSSHTTAKDRARDAILESAGLPIVRVNVREIPTPEQLRAVFAR